MKDFSSMSLRTRAYWCLIVFSGITSACLALAGWHLAQQHYLRFICLVLMATAVSGFKIQLPGVFGTLSMTYVAILISLLQLGPAPAMIVALISTTGQCLIHSNTRPKWFQVVFSVAGVPVPVLAANWALHWGPLAALDPTGWQTLLVAAMAYFALNTVAVAGIIGLSTGDSFWNVWRNSYLWTWPQYLVGGAIAGIVNYFLTRNQGWSALLVSAPPLYLLYRSYTNYLDRVREQQDHISEIASLHLRTIETLALAIDAKDDTTAAHLRRVQVYAAGIGKELNLPPLEMQALHAAALLHDVGKLAVPEYIISKPGKLTAEEFEKMKVHPVVGAEILDRVNFPYPVVPIVRCHHEKYDGTGYPAGLSGEDIPIGARILSAVDCFDALASDRQYRKALPLEQAIRIVSSESGKAFDPKVVAVLEKRYKELERKAKEDTAEYGLTRPNVRVERGIAPATGLALQPPRSVDVSANTNFSLSIANARREIQLLTQLINDLGNSLSLDDTLALLAVRLEKNVKHDALAVFLERDGVLVPRFVKGESFRLFAALEIPLGQGLSGWVAENNKPIVNGNPAVEIGILNDPAKFTLLRSAIVIPLRSEDTTVGVLALYSLSSDAFTSDHNRLLLAVAPKAAHAIQNSLRFQDTSVAADTDELTGLANARALYSGLERQVSMCSRSGSSFAVILMDLDGFKQANDRYGHLAGNRILQAVARGLRRYSRAGDIVARLGGDEFVVVHADSNEEPGALVACLDRITRDLAIDAQCDANITFSVGVATYPADAADAETLLERADERMYEAKRNKKLALVA
jgi:diguanylate cyclase (GGDEF)-like protein/putative nucleotidyltransferase with HDIG domain